MKKLLLLTFLGITFVAKAQKSVEDEPIYTSAETNPVYLGGNEALFKFICENLNTPKDVPTDNKLNKVFIKFVVEKGGQVTHPEIMKGINDECNKEAVRVVNLLKWQAGGMKKYGIWQPLRVYMFVPITFHQNKAACENAYSQLFKRN